MTFVHCAFHADRITSYLHVFPIDGAFQALCKASKHVHVFDIQIWFNMFLFLIQNIVVLLKYVQCFDMFL